MSTPYRNSAATGRDPTRCLHCGAHLDARVTCPSCGGDAPPADAPRARELNVSCPRCYIGLELSKQGDEGEFLYCIGCHGCFVPPGDWGLIVDGAQSVSPESEIAGGELTRLPPEQGLVHGALAPRIDCPVCRKEMDRKTWQGSQEEVDVCTMHGIWFDAAELSTVLRESSHAALAPDHDLTLKEDRRAKQRLAMSTIARLLLG